MESNCAAAAANVDVKWGGCLIAVCLQAPARLLDEALTIGLPVSRAPANMAAIVAPTAYAYVD